MLIAPYLRIMTDGYGQLLERIMEASASQLTDKGNRLCSLRL